MKEYKRPTPSNFEQFDGFTGRILKNPQEEDVNYLWDSHCRFWRNTQNEGYSMHHHGALEIIICMEDHYTIIANSKTYVLNVGDILFIPPNMLHELKDCNGGVRFVCLINIQFLYVLQDLKTLDPLFIEPYLCNAAAQPQIYQQVYSLFMQMIESYFSGNVFWESIVYSSLLQALALIGRNYLQTGLGGSSDITDDKQKEYYEKFSMLLEYISDNYMEDMTLDQVADYVGFSKYHFSRLFKQYTNTTFYDYLCRKRVSAAQSLLSTNMPITDIAFQTGFNNLTTFCRCFKKCTNCSPTEYRNKFRQERIK